MLLYSTFWLCGLDSCQPTRSAPIHAWLDLFFTRQVHGIAMHSRKESPFASRPLPLGPSKLCRDRQSAAATDEDHRCRLLPPRRQQALQQPSSAICRKDDLLQATRGRRKLVVSLLELARRAPSIRWLSRWQSCWAVLSVRRLVLECQPAKAQ